MAFALAQTWNAAAPSPSGLAPLGLALSHRQETQLRRAGATAFSILVHILLIWVLLNKLSGGMAGEGEGAGAGNGALMSFALSDPASAAASASEPEQVPQPRVERAPVSDVDSTAPTDLPPPEWTVSRLPPAQSQRPAAASGSAFAGTSAGAGASGAGAGAGQGGTQVYDPYAGAAPLRMNESGAGASSTANMSLGARVLGFLGLDRPAAAGLTLDETALEAIRRAVERSLPGRRGTAEITVRVSPTGMVLEASARGGSAPAEARSALGRALIGKRLFSGAAVEAQTLTLPILRLG
jgi:hypothetical protein